MPHTRRKKSESGFYHVVTKGDGGQILFEDDRDRKTYIARLEELVREGGLKIHAYCLMSNHVHLLVKDEKESLSEFMKMLDEHYAMHFSKKTGRVGHVFQDRFWSEAVETDGRFLATLRYIHANPEPTGICKAEEYPWSSYQDYITAGRKGSMLTTTELALAMLEGVQGFERFHESGGRYVLPFAGSGLKNHLTDAEMMRVAIELVGREVLNGMKQLPVAERAKHLAELAGGGFTPTQIARLTGLGQSSIHKALARE